MLRGQPDAMPIVILWAETMAPHAADILRWLKNMDRSTFLTMFETADTVERLMPGLAKGDRERQKLRLGMLLLMLDRLAFLTRLAPDKRLRKTLIAEYADIMWTAIFSSR